MVSGSVTSDIRVGDRLESRPLRSPRRPQGREPEHFAFVDALRGIAFLGVALFHCLSVVKGLPETLVAILDKGNYGVQLFYVASAFTLFLSLDQRMAVDERPVLFFFIRRVFRIAPMFWVAIVFYLVLHGTGPRDFAPYGLGVTHIVSTFLFVHGWHPETINSVVPGGWSIAVEMMFYLSVPIFFLYARSLRRMVPVFLVLLVVSRVASWAVRQWLSSTMPSAAQTAVAGFSYYWLPAQMPVFCLGFILFLVLRNRLVNSGTQGLSDRGRSAILLCAAGVFAGAFVAFRIPSAFLGFAVIGMLVAWALALHPNVVFVNRYTRYAGKVSYSAYLVHFAVYETLGRFVGHMAWFLTLPSIVQYFVFVALTVALTLAVSTLTYWAIEEPGRQLGKLVIRRLRQPRTAIAA